jgi:peptidyl-prolyl cis-trans isomerase C/foldase protein PrsA
MRLASALFVAVLLSACPPDQKAKQDPNVVATVNGEVIPRAEFERLLAREAQAMEGNAPRTPEQVEPFKQALLETQIEKVLLLQAARAANITVTTEEVDRRVLALSSEYPAGTFDEALTLSGTSRAALTRSTREQLTIEKLLAQEVHSRVAVSEEQIRRYYDEHTADFSEQEQVHAQQIVVKGLAVAGQEVPRPRAPLLAVTRCARRWRPRLVRPRHHAARVRRGGVQAQRRRYVGGGQHRVRLPPVPRHREAAGAQA